MESLVRGLVVIVVTVIGILAAVYIKERSPLQRLSHYLDIQDRDQYQMLVLAIALLFFGLMFSLFTFVSWAL